MRILVFGDSITYGSWDSQGGWADRLKRELHRQYVDTGGETKVQLLNLGIGGEAGTGILARLEAEIEARQSTSWQFVFVFAYGTNDSRTLDGESQTTIEQLRANTKQIIKVASTYSPRILFVGAPPISVPELGFKLHRYNDALIGQYSEVIRGVAETEGVSFMATRPAYEASADSLFAADGLHPNDAGHELIASLVRPELDKLIS